MIIPVIRGRIGDWRYYSGIMSFKQISDNVTASIGELYQAQCLNDLLQRELTSNFAAIKEYLLKDNERFFNAVILAIYDGDPKWLEIEFANEEYNNVGFLQFSGDEVLFPVDGQHRVTGIKEALKEKKELEQESVPVIFIAHSQTEEGRKRTRKLFSTLNRRAKPVGQNENIALDEDDVCSIITRELLQSFPLCMGENIVNHKGKQIPNNNKTAFTSLIALYQCVCAIVQHKLQLKTTQFKKFQLYRPNDETVLELTDYVFDVFNSFVNNTDSVRTYSDLTTGEKAVSYRNNEGGNILFRPIVLTDYFDIAMTLITRDDLSVDDAFSRLNSVPQDLADEPWKGLLWDGEKIINRLSHTVIKNLLLLMTSSIKLTEKEYEGLVNAFSKALSIDEKQSKKLLKKYQYVK